LAASTTLADGSIVTTFPVMRSLICGIPLLDRRVRAIPSFYPDAAPTM
jgi:hypothetical protein